MVDCAHRIRCVVGVCKPPEGAAVKSCGAQRSGKDAANTPTDEAGNRILKEVNGRKTWYVRDAQGNVVSVYSYGDNTINGGNLTQSETHLYGSSRLGMSTSLINVQNVAATALTNLPGLGVGTSANFIRGKKFFELSNHLGNVLATVSDKKIGMDTN